MARTETIFVLHWQFKLIVTSFVEVIKNIAVDFTCYKEWKFRWIEMLLQTCITGYQTYTSFLFISLSLSLSLSWQLEFSYDNCQELNTFSKSIKLQFPNCIEISIKCLHFLKYGTSVSVNTSTSFSYFKFESNCSSSWFLKLLIWGLCSGILGWIHDIHCTRLQEL